MPASRSLNIRPWMLVTILCLLYVVFVLIRNQGDPLALVTIGTRFDPGIIDGSEG